MYDPRDPWPFLGNWDGRTPAPKALRMNEPRLGTSFHATVKVRRGGKEDYTIGGQLRTKIGNREFGKLLDKMMARAS